MNGKKQYSTDYSQGFAVGFLYASTEQNINTVVAQAGGTLSGQDLARRLGELLLSKTSGWVLDSSERLPKVRAYTSKRYAISTGSKKVHVRPRTDGTQSKLSPQAIYWGKMTPLQRKREMIRRGMLGGKKQKTKAYREKMSLIQKAIWAKKRELKAAA
jgi:hypothetical protein